MRLVTVGVGAARSPRFAPAGLCVVRGCTRVWIDGGRGAAPPTPVDAWLVTDERCEEMPRIRALARRRGLAPAARDFRGGGLDIRRLPVVHTSHPCWGYRIRAREGTAVWAPEFLEFPAWAAGADLLFAEAAGWDRPIRFRGGVGGHAAALAVCRAARRHGVRRLVLAHLGRPTIRALDRGERPRFGVPARDGQVFRLTRRAGAGAGERLHGLDARRESRRRRTAGASAIARGSPLGRAEGARQGAHGRGRPPRRRP
jgi:hypothetical protein